MPKGKRNTPNPRTIALDAGLIVEPKSTSDLALNVHGDKFVLLRDYPLEKFRTIILDYESARLSDWFHTFAKQHAELPSNKLIQGYGANANSTQRPYFKPNFFRSLAGSQERKIIIAKLASLTASQQSDFIISEAPKSRTEMYAVTTRDLRHIVFPCNFMSLVKGCETFASALERLIAFASKRDVFKSPRQRASLARCNDLLCYMAGRGILLYPARFSLASAFLPEMRHTLVYLGENKRILLENFARHSKLNGQSLSQLTLQVRHALLTTDLDSIEQVTSTFLEQLQELFFEHQIASAADMDISASRLRAVQSQVRSVIRLLTDLRNETHPDNRIEPPSTYDRLWRSAESHLIKSDFTSIQIDWEQVPSVRMEPVDVFDGHDSDQYVQLNTSPTEFVLLRTFSIEEYLALVTDFEQLTLKSFFDEIGEVDESDQSRLVAWSPLGPRRRVSSCWVRSTALDSIDVPGRTLKLQLQHLAKSPIENQAQFLKALTRTDRAGARSVLSERKLTQLLAIDFRSITVKDFSPVDTIRTLVGLTRDSEDKNNDTETNTRTYHRPSSRNFLRFLVCRGIVLLPLPSGEGILSPILRPNLDIYLDSGRKALLEAIYDVYATRAAKTSSLPVMYASKALLFSSTLTDQSQLSSELLLAFEKAFINFIKERFSRGVINKKTLSNHMGALRRVSEIFSILINKNRPAAPFEHKTSIESLPVGKWKGGRSQSFAWALKIDSRLSTWVDLFDRYVLHTGSLVKQLRPIRRYLNYWLDYLLTHAQERPYLPELITRNLHLINSDSSVQTFSQYLSDQNYSSATISSALYRLSDFFDWLKRLLFVEGKVFDNPIYIDIDVWKSDPSNGQTFRQALNQDQINALKKVISADNFAFCRDRSRFRRDYVMVLDHETGSLVEEWFPGRARALLLMLQLPLRSFQTIWMDSGEGDEKELVLDRAQITPPVQRPNSHPNSTVGRSMGPLRMSYDPDGTSFIGLYCPTNKTAVAQKRKDIGQLIPWVDDEVVENICEMQAWQARYGHKINHPVEAILSGEESSREYRTKVMVYPLFRDPTRLQRELPVSSGRIKSLFHYALVEVDRLSREANPTLKPMIVVREGASTQTRFDTIYDLHSLRVSGISNLLDAGVPLEVVSRYMAGHHSIVMTLWYNKMGVKKVREQLMAARRRSLTSDLDPTEQLLNLHAQEGDHQLRLGAKERDATWRVKLDGICPGAVCTEGIIDSYGNPSPVPDSRCSLCRFHLTGPRFMVGNTLLMTEIFRRVHSREGEMRDTQEQLNTLIAAKKRGDRIPQGEMNVLEGRITQLRNLQRLDLEDLAARKVAMEACRDLTASGREGALVSTGSEQETLGGLKSGLHAQNLHVLSLATEIIPGYRNDDAVRELRDLIESVLANNGVLIPLARLEPSERLAAVNLFSDLLFEAIPDDHDAAAAIDGQRSLAEFHARDGRPLDAVFASLGERMRELKSSRKSITAESLSFEEATDANNGADF